MPEHLRALVIICVLATPFFLFSQQLTCNLISKADFALRRNLWFALTIIAFLAQNFWFYALAAILLLLFPARREQNKIALFFFILFALPMATIPIPGMGLISFLFELSHARILALLILLPAFLALIRHSDTPSFGRTGPDKILAAYLLLTIILHLRESSATDTLRQSFYIFLDVFLPYFVISRSQKHLQIFRDTLLSFVMAVMVLAIFGIFEAFKHWLLYFPLLGALGLEGLSGYLGREGFVRAVATAGQPIALGYLMVVGLGFYLYIQNSIQKKLARRLGMVLLIGGLLAALSRGPWVGAVVLLIAFIATGRFAIRRLMRLTLAAILAIPLIVFLPGGERVINLLPFIGSTEKNTVDFREELITNSIIVIQRNPWFGSVDYLKTPEMEAMRNGSWGIIDVVNSYIGIALEFGIVGLGLFVVFFLLVVIGVYRTMHSLPDRDCEEYLLGRALLATLLAIMVIILTVSSITIIPIVYWSVAGLGVAYAKMVRKHANEKV